MATVTKKRLDSGYEATVETIVRSRINCDKELRVGMVVHVGSKRSQYQGRVLSIKKRRLQVQQLEEETTPKLPSGDMCQLGFSGLSDSDGEDQSIPVNKQHLLPPIIHCPEIREHEAHLAELCQPTSEPTKELQRPQLAPYHTELRQPTTQPTEELQRPETAPHHADLCQAAPYQPQYPIYHQPELRHPSFSRHLFEAQPPAGHLESLILQLSSKLTAVTNEIQEQQRTLVREVHQLREEVRTLSGVKEKCPVVFTPVPSTNSRIFIGSAESRLEMDKADYMKCWEAASTPKELVLSLLSLHFTSAELAASNFNGGEVVCSGRIVTKTALRKDSRFVAIVSQAEAQFPGGHSSPALQRQLRDAINNKCRKCRHSCKWNSPTSA